MDLFLLARERERKGAMGGEKQGKEEREIYYKALHVATNYNILKYNDLS